MNALEKLGYLQYPCDENTWIKDANTQIIFYNGKPYGFYMGRERVLTPEEKTACSEVIKEMENPMEKTVSLEYYVNNIKVTRKEYIADFTAGAKHNLGAGRDIAKEFIGHDESQALNYGYSMFQFDTGGLFEIKRLLK